MFRELTTHRLLLRRLALSDGEQMAAIRSDNEVNKYISREPCLSLSEAEAFIRQIQTGVANSGWYYWAICLKEDDRLIGTICLWNVDLEKGRAELGYELLPASQGKGIMSEALREVLGFAFNDLLYKSIAAVTNRDNRKSVSLLERFGFVKEISYQDEADLFENGVVLVLTGEQKK